MPSPPRAPTASAPTTPMQKPPNMARYAIVPLILLLAAGCSSSGDQVDASESYRGQLAAAVAPLALARPAHGFSETANRATQRQMAIDIGAAGIFASVGTLSSLSEANEAEVIIQPTLLELSTGAGDTGMASLKIRASRKSGGRVGVEKVYTGRCRHCGGQSAAPAAIADAMKAVIRDLKRAYKAKPAY